jgi:hypothetical protein
MAMLERAEFDGQVEAWAGLQVVPAENIYIYIFPHMS